MMVYCEASAEGRTAMEWNIIGRIRVRIELIVEEAADERRKMRLIDVRRKIFGIVETSNYSTAA
jgi:hypothetical protein